MDQALLDGEDDPAVVVNGDGASRFFLVCEHAGRRIPRRLGDLGLSAQARRAHIAWDIGAEAVARRLSARLDAPLVLQRYSRLVVDCNRPPDSAEAMPAVSETTPVPGNAALDTAARGARVKAIFTPFHATVARLLDEREARGERPVLVTIHSFTPVYRGEARPWHAGAQYNRAPAFSRLVNDMLGRIPGLVVADNVPYPVNDATHYTIPVHGERRGITHTMIEIRNDLVGDEAGQARWADRLEVTLRDALAAHEGQEQCLG